MENLQYINDFQANVERVQKIHLEKICPECSKGGGMVDIGSAGGFPLKMGLVGFPIIITLFLFFSISNPSYTQTNTVETGKIIEKSTDIGGGDFEYIARDHIRFLQGFHYKSSTGHQLHAHIDESMVFPVDPVPAVTDATITNRKIDTSLPVGVIQGTPSVSPSGAFTYTIPINLPKGTAGMQPSLTLAYNSQAGNGVFGMGWNITGLSAITRVPHTIYHDGTPRAVKLDDQDVFALDGNRLNAKTGDYGKIGTIYQTEIETFNNITSNGTSGSGPDNFMVETADGRTMEYGNSLSSKFMEDPLNGNNVIFWMLNKVYDNYGNYIEYTYKNANSEIQIDEINYTGNSVKGLSPYIKIKFLYESRSDVNKYFIAGSAIISNLLLRKINITIGERFCKSYRFEYSQDPNQLFSLLAEVIESGSDGKSLNSIILKYGNTTPVITEHTSNFLDNSKSRFFLRDINGDGKTDVVRWLDVNVPKQWDVLENEGGFLTSTLDVFDFPNGVLPPINSYPIDKDATGHLLFNMTDFNGDGNEDAVFSTLRDNNDGTVLIKHYFNYFGQTNIIETKQLSSDQIPVNSNFAFRFLDMDGDQRTDFFTKGLSVNIRTSSESGTLDVVKENNDLLSYDFSNSFPADLDGDGKGELINVKKDWDSFYIVRLDENNNLIIENQKIYSDHSIKLFGDFNGDGTTDAVYPGTNRIRTDWYIDYNKYNLKKAWENLYVKRKVFSGIFQLHAPTTDGSSGAAHFVVDINGDGKSDIVEIFSTTFNLFLSTGFSFKKIHYDWTYGSKAVRFADFDGDKNLEVFIKTGSGSQIIICDLGLDIKNNMLQSVSNSLNQKISVKYNTFAIRNSDAYKYEPVSPYNDVLDGTFTYPLTELHKNIYAVKTLTTPDGVGGTVPINYAYEKSMYAKNGKGFLGFSKTTQTNTITKISSTTNYELLPDVFYPVVSSTITEIPDVEVLESSTYKFRTASRTIPKSFLVLLDNVSTVNYLNGTQKEVTTTYGPDNNGPNPTKIITSYGGGIETETVDLTWVMKGSWIENKIETKIITRQRTGDQSFITNSSYTYYNEGTLHEQKDFVGKPKEISNTFIYDDFGNIKKQTLSTTEANMVARTTEYDYDPAYHRSITKIINPLLQETIIENNLLWAKPEKITGIDKKITTNEYDTFGRLIKTIGPDGITTTRTLKWVLTGDNVLDAYSNQIPEVAYFKESITEGSPKVKIWYDKTGRVVKTETEGFSEPLFSTILYNKNGQVEKRSGSYTTANPLPVTTTYTYDTKGRILSEDNTRVLTSYTYQKTDGGLLSVTTTAPGFKSIKVFDATGKLKTVEDVKGSTLEYSYYSNGHLKETLLNGQRMALMDYDDYGRQELLWDANAGSINYEYNAYGELAWQKDANNIETRMEYGGLGQIKTLTNPDGETAYNYNLSGNGINQVESITPPNGYNTSYIYDELGRVTSSTETIDGANYISQFEYDRFSNPIKETYPSGFQIERKYDNKGFLLNIKNLSDNKYIWQTDIVNKYGQYTKFILSNDMVTTKTIDNFGILSQIKTTGNIGDIFDLSLGWDIQKGNLLSRTDNIRQISESFSQYDDLNRLEKMQVTNPDKTKQNELTTSYYDNGNIKSKGELDNFIYNLPQPNALSCVDNSGNIISVVEQNINYNNDGKVKLISEGYNNELTYFYGYDKQRRKSVLKPHVGSPVRTIIYAGNYEKIEVNGKVYELHYILTPNGISAINVKHDDQSQMFYVHTDHLGSFLKITDDAGNTIWEQNYDAWGRNRNPETWGYDMSTYHPNPPANFDPRDWLIRGFTGHEHLPEFALINMNGRMYDPAIGRMLSPDNYIQTPDFSQGYNRYSYAFNNPLVYTDPSGEMTWFGALVTVVGTGLGVTAAVLSGGTVGWVGYWDDETGEWKAVVFGTAATEYGGLVVIGQNKQGEFEIYGSVVYTPDLNKNQPTQPLIDESIPSSPTNEPLAKTVDMQNSFTGQEGSGSGGLITQNLNNSQFGGITREQGGFIDNYNDFFNFMVDKARNEFVEVAAFKVQTEIGTRYYVQPWQYNTAGRSYNNFDIPGGYGRKNISDQYHTHRDFLGPSIIDAKFSQRWTLPVYIIGPDGNIWITDLYPKGYFIPRFSEGIPYGKLIRR